MQTLDLQITIPENLVVIEKSEYNEFLEQQLIGRVWNMQQLEKVTNRSAQWLKENVLEVPEYKEELEAFVHFPKAQGERWKFGALRMSEWLEENQELMF